MRDHKRATAAVVVLVALGLSGCASEGPCREQDLTVSAPVTSSYIYPGCHGRNVAVVARLRPHGSQLEALRVLVTGKDGAASVEPPSVRVRGGASVQAITTDGSAAVVWFGCPGPCDGSVIRMNVIAPPSSPCPFRVRLVPVFQAR